MKKSKINKKCLKKLYTVKDFLYWTFNQFKKSNIWYGHGTDNAWDEASYLIFTKLGIPHIINIPKKIYETNLTINERNILLKLIIKRLIQRIPIAYLVNKAWFCEKEFYIDKRVLIPRSPISELINNKFCLLIKIKPKRILDLCTGSGCIAISCSYVFPETIIDAVDISEDALKVAKKNVNFHQLNNIRVIKSDLFNNLNKKYDIIITNPPYVNLNDIKILPKEYLYEPNIGFNAGHDSLNIIKKILLHAKNYLTNSGKLICEVGQNNIYNLFKYYLGIKFKLINFKNGGKGVFVLNKKELIMISEKF